jgi:hypothetical protein
MGTPATYISVELFKDKKASEIMAVTGHQTSKEGGMIGNAGQRCKA